MHLQLHNHICDVLQLRTVDVSRVRVRTWHCAKQQPHHSGILIEAMTAQLHLCAVTALSF